MVCMYLTQVDGGRTAACVEKTSLKIEILAQNSLDALVHIII